MEAVAKRHPQQRGVARQRLDQQAGVRHVEDGVGHRHRGRQRGARLVGQQACRGDDQHDRREIRMRLEAVHEAVGQRHREPPEARRRRVVRDGPRTRRRARRRRRARGGSQGRARRRRAPRPQRWPPRTTRDPAPAGSGSRPWSANGGSGSCIRSATAAIVREIRSPPSVGSSSAPSQLPGHRRARVRVERDDVADVEREPERVEPRAEVGRGRWHARRRRA